MFFNIFWFLHTLILKSNRTIKVWVLFFLSCSQLVCPFWDFLAFFGATEGNLKVNLSPVVLNGWGQTHNHTHVGPRDDLKAHWAQLLHLTGKGAKTQRMHVPRASQLASGKGASPGTQVCLMPKVMHFYCSLVLRSLKSPGLHYCTRT